MKIIVSAHLLAEKLNTIPENESIVTAYTGINRDNLTLITAHRTVEVPAMVILPGTEDNQQRIDWRGMSKVFSTVRDQPVVLEITEDEHKVKLDSKESTTDILINEFVETEIEES